MLFHSTIIHQLFRPPSSSSKRSLNSCYVLLINARQTLGYFIVHQLVSFLSFTSRGPKFMLCLVNKPSPGLMLFYSTIIHQLVWAIVNKHPIGAQTLTLARCDVTHIAGVPSQWRGVSSCARQRKPYRGQPSLFPLLSRSTMARNERLFVPVNATASGLYGLMVQIMSGLGRFMSQV